MKMKKLLLGFEVILTSITFSQTYIPPGEIYGNWSVVNSPYYIQGDVTIPNDSTLTIQPGVLIEFQGHYAFYVLGRLLAIGTAASNITFTINDTTGFYNPDTTLGGWNGLRFIDTPEQNDTSKIFYCKIQYGKAVGPDWFMNSGGALCILHFDKVIISNCNITNCSAGGSGFAVGGALAVGLSDVQLINNVISNNTADAGGAIHFFESDPLLINNIIENNFAATGGALDIQTKSHPVFSNDQIINNHSTNAGGAINIGGDSVVAIFNECIISGNSSHFGGAINAWTCGLQLNYCTLTDNAASWIGGSINAGFSNIQINNSIFERDTAYIFGGAMGIYNSELIINGSSLTGNGAGNLGGGIHSDYSSIIISNTTFERDTSGDAGGGIFTWQSSLNVEDCEFINNSATNNGGAISSSNCHLLIDSCTFYQNLAGNEAGAIECLIDTSYFTEKLLIQINNSEFLNNNSGNLFAGVKIRQDNSDTALCSVRMNQNLFKGNTANSYSAIRFIGNIDDIIVNNSIFEGNFANQFTSIFSANGGAKVKVNNSVFAKNYPRAASLNINARIDFMNCTFVNNYGTNSSGLSLRNNAEATLTNSILWNNGNNPILLVNVGSNGNILTVNYSNIQFGPDSLIVPGSLSILNWGVGNIDAEPLFVDTLNNDFHLQEFSPCIVAGIDSIEIEGFLYHSPSTDIEGNPRPYPVGTMPDMGAYESVFPVGVSNEASDLPTNYILFQNYPNPFNPSTKIKYTIPNVTLSGVERSRVQLKVYDVLGNEVATVVNEDKPVGEYQIEFNANKLSSGVYFYQLKVGEFISTKKMILLR